jgi:hypothetical protein
VKLGLTLVLGTGRFRLIAGGALALMLAAVGTVVAWHLR